MRKQFTSYLLPFLMNYLERWACREDGSYSNRVISRQPAPSNFHFDISTTYAGSCTLLCFSVMYLALCTPGTVHTLDSLILRYQLKVKYSEKHVPLFQSSSYGAGYILYSIIHIRRAATPLLHSWRGTHAVSKLHKGWLGDKL